MLSEKFYQIAKDMLQKKDFIEFLWNLSKAELLSDGKPDMMAKISFLKVQGFYKCHQYRKGLEYIDEALKFMVASEDGLKIKNYRGMMFGYLGNFGEAKEVFVSLLDDIQSVEFLVEVYLNLVWVVGSQHRATKNPDGLNEIKDYLDLAYSHFGEVSTKTKGKILDSMSTYTFLTGNYEEAINLGEKALEYFEEKDLPKIYNNLANMYLEMEKGEEYSVPLKAQEYMKKAELIGEEYKNRVEVGKSLYNQAMAQLKEDQFFTALDLLYISFEYFKEAEALTLAFDCLLKMNELMNSYKDERLTALRDTMKNGLKDTSFYSQI